jgi:glycosyltransferase involved in cell wall biosynthesis
MSISFAITVCNEYLEIKRLLELITPYQKENDEIVILLDKSNSNTETLNYLYALKDNNSIKLHIGEFNGDFSEWKNNLISYCSKEYIFNLDADETVSEILLENLHNIINLNPTCEAYWLPRENYVEGITENHLKAWGWRMDNKKRIQYPDPQLRLFRNNPSKIRWVGKIHEKIEGYSTISSFPYSEEYSIFHYKDIQKQEKQNNYYSKIG